MMAKESLKPPESAEELLRRYRAGEREFPDSTLVGAQLNFVNLSGAILSGANLSGAKLHGTNLSRAGLSLADLSDAYLHSADLSEVGLIRANLRHADLNDAILRGANLALANLTGASCPGSNLQGADLGGANLMSASFALANLGGSNLSSANLTGAHLVMAYLHGANISNADLCNADLRDANLGHANLSSANLVGANLGGAQLAATMLLDLDLSSLCDADPPIVHLEPSAVDFRSVVKSLRSPNLRAFLQRTGMPELVIDYMVECAESLNGSISKRTLRSTFISYGSPDEPFARKLYEALHRNGVTTFFFAEHAVPGDKLHRMMRTKVNEYDRVILVCSKASLDRKGVLNEIEETLTREARDGGAAYLIPIRLDSYVFSGWAPANPDTAQAVRDRVVADFEGADGDSAKFDAGLLRLIAALKK